MPCEHYQDALAAAAATGSNPQGELRSHLDACPSCRAAFDQEVSLFAAIDSGLNFVANQNVPPSLLPRVRASIAESPAPARRWLPRYAFAAITATVVLAIFFMLRPRLPGPVNQASQRPLITKPLPSSQGPESPRTRPTFLASANLNQPRPRTSTPTSPIHSQLPEVLVPAEQETLLAYYSARWEGRTHPLLRVASSSEAVFISLDVAPIQIDQLDVKPLADGGPQ
jgi:hypothetical protein